jgi:hypothetical protein
MAFVTAEQARAGMVLAAEVTDRRGRLLIPAGNELTDRHVQALHMWGVTHLEIEGDEPEDEAMAAISPEVIEMAEAQTAQRFAELDTDHPFVAALRHCVVRRRAETLAQEASA